MIRYDGGKKGISIIVTSIKPLVSGQKREKTHNSSYVPPIVTVKMVEGHHSRDIMGI